jgi:hypothetical protein
VSDDRTTLTPARSALVAAASALVGLAYPDQAYLDAVAPGESSTRQAEMGKESGCALTLRGVLLQLFTVPLQPAYVDGSAFSVLWRLAGGSPWLLQGACRKATQEAPPRVGDAIVYNAAPGGKPPVHVDAVVLEATPTGEDLTIVVVAGGQEKETEAGIVECIAKLTRRLRWSGSAWVDLGDARPVLVVLDADAWPMPLRC